MRIYSNDPSNGLMLVKILGNRYEPNGLVINYDEITDARYLDVLVSLNNYSGVTAIQADFSYPKEYYTTSNKNITLTERCSDFTKTAIAVNDSTFKVLIFSMNNELISGNEGNIFKIRLTRKEGADNQTATVSLKNIILSDVKGNDKNSFGNQMKSVNLMSNVSVNCNPSNSGAVTGTGSYHKGTEVILTATPNVGYRFVNWTENNIVVSSDLEYLFVITSERNLVANFTLIDYDVTTSVNIENSGTVTGAGNYLHGDEVTLTAIPNVGYRFVNWTENNEVISEESVMCLLCIYSQTFWIWLIIFTILSTWSTLLRNVVAERIYLFALVHILVIQIRICSLKTYLVYWESNHTITKYSVREIL